MNEKSAYLHKFESLLAKEMIEINTLKSKLTDMPDDERQAYEQQLKVLLNKDHNIRQKLDQIRDADSPDWQRLRPSVERSLKDLRETVKATVEAI